MIKQNTACTVATKGFFKLTKKQQRQQKRLLERRMQELEKLCDDIDWFDGALPDRVLDLAYDIGPLGLTYLKKRMDSELYNPNLRLEGF